MTTSSDSAYVYVTQEVEDPDFSEELTLAWAVTSFTLGPMEGAKYLGIITCCAYFVSSNDCAWFI